jgi:hypothetical protein
MNKSQKIALAYNALIIVEGDRQKALAAHAAAGTNYYGDANAEQFNMLRHSELQAVLALRKLGISVIGYAESTDMQLVVLMTEALKDWCLAMRSRTAA